jgi:iron transport multicopper oxidase
MAGCIITALIGIGSVVWYGWGPLDEEDVEEEVKRKVAAKKGRGSRVKGWFKK